VALRVLRFVFAPEEKVEERAISEATRPPGTNVSPAPLKLPIITMAPLTRREPRWGFFLQACDAEEPRRVLVPSSDNG
jgi:hypothetical protein